jgi:DNA polymerase
MGAKFALMKERGKVLHSDYADNVIAILHPSAILRAPDSNRATEMRHMLRSDLMLAAKLIAR